MDVHRVGASKNMQTLNRRRLHYQRNGYSGRMYYARTFNMQMSENTLLALCGDKCYRNIHKTSNVPPTIDYVYVLDEVDGYGDDDFNDDYDDEAVRQSQMTVQRFGAPMSANNFVYSMNTNYVVPPRMVYPNFARAAVPVQESSQIWRSSNTHTQRMPQMYQRQFHDDDGYMWGNGNHYMPSANAGVYRVYEPECP
jgi:hypothetical protein